MELEFGGQKLTLKWIHAISLLTTAFLLSAAAAAISLAYSPIYSFALSNFWIVVVAFYFLFAEVSRRMEYGFGDRDFVALSLAIAAAPALIKVALLCAAFLLRGGVQGTEGAAAAIFSDLLSMPISAFVSFMAFRFTSDFSAKRAYDALAPALIAYASAIILIFSAHSAISGDSFWAPLVSMLPQTLSMLFYMISFFAFVNAQKRFLELELWGGIAVAFVIIKYSLGLLSLPMLIFYTVGAVGAYALVHFRK